MPEEKKTRRLLIDEFIPEDAREHAHAARQEMRKTVEALYPPGFLEHRRAARREMLLALRSIIDHALDRMGAEEKKK